MVILNNNNPATNKAGDTDEISCQISQLEKKLSQEEAIHKAIVQMRDKYEAGYAIAKAKQLLEETERRITYFRAEIRHLKSNPVDLSNVQKTAIMSPLDYWRPTTLTGAMVEFKIHELLYRLHVEEKLWTGSGKVIEAIKQMPQSATMMQPMEAANASKQQCAAKIELLQAAIKSYQLMLIDRPFDEAEEDEEGDVFGQQEKAIKGKLLVKVRDVMKSSRDEGDSLLITVSTDGKERFTEKLKRRDKCRLNSEGIEFDLNTAGGPVSYFELLVRTKSLEPVGILFFKLSWLLNESQDKKILKEHLSLEPDGLVDLEIRFEPDHSVKETSKPIAELDRHNAIKVKRAIKLGHELVAKKYYSPKNCAVCQELVYHISAYRCESTHVYSERTYCNCVIDCRFLCHKKCAGMIMAKCVAAIPTETGQELHYNVPHGFEPFKALLPAWCMHCGKSGRKDFLRCTQCGSTCHQDCVHYVPNFCRLPKELPALAALRISEKPNPIQDLEGPDRIQNYELISLIGKGNFGKVLLAKQKNTGRMVAIKAIRVAMVVENDEGENVETEAEVFRVAQKGSHPFLLQPITIFSDPLHYYFVMEYVGGGDLMFHIQKRKFTEDQARFYSAQVLLALEHLHKHDIVYRDLKLDNIMLAADGYVKLADYGLCKTGMDWRAGTSTFCGTPEFIAPEILAERWYTRAVDWWAFGVLVYELVLGQSPFSGKGEAEIFKSILAGRVYFPARCSPEARDLIQRLLVRNPKSRLGAGAADSAPIKQHPFFKNINFDRLIMKLDKAPFLPTINSPLDVSNFDIQFTGEAASLNMSQQ